MEKRDFEQFYRENLDRIFRYVFFRVGRNRSVAEDLVSEIFMKALQKFETYDPTISKSAWIYRIAHNHLANYFRDRKEQVDLDDVMFTLEGEHGVVSMERRGDELKVEAAMMKLSAQERRLVTLKHLEGYSYQEMSEMLGKTPDALKVATHRCMAKLKTLCSGSSDN